jgi:sRNA-binding carbon storage regulator CsrA
MTAPTQDPDRERRIQAMVDEARRLGIQGQSDACELRLDRMRARNARRKQATPERNLMPNLILKRREHESVLLKLPDGREVIITVVHLSPSMIKLGIEAPEDVRVSRPTIGNRQSEIINPC